MPNKLDVWRIENFEMVPVPKEQHGRFFSGDSYIVLRTKEDRNSGKLSYDLHMWIGNESSQDEYGACAIQATMLDDKYDGLPVQYRETQGYESPLFLGYFKPSLKTLSGGVASGFTHAKTNDYSTIKRLMWVRGRMQVRADQVPMKWESLNQSDCFIFDMGHKIHVWCGEKSNKFEQLKAKMVANEIDNDERAGRAVVKDIPSSGIKALEQFLGAYPGSITEGVPEESGRSRTSVKSSYPVKLLQVSDDSGKMVTSLVSEQSPFDQKDLDETNMFLICNKSAGQIFIWKGKGASKEERKAAMRTATSFIEQEGMPKHTRVTVMTQNAETALFKNMFKTWVDIDSQKGLGEVWSINKIAKVKKVDFDASTLHTKPDLAAKYQLPDAGSGQTQIWRVEGSSKKEISRTEIGQFYGGDCYIVLYSYEPRGREQYLLYYWIGSKASTAEVTALPILTIKTDEDLCRGAATQIRVVQGKEPPHMLMIFGGRPLIVYKGGTSRSGGQTDHADTRLFHVRSGFMGRCRAVEVDAKTSSLNSNDAFLLVTRSNSFLWSGKGASDAENKAAQDVVTAIGAKRPSMIEEEEEPEAFWGHLGGKGEYNTDPRMEGEVRPACLFECCDASGNFKVEEVCGDWVQPDLNPDNVMLLDAWTCIYVWIGRNSSQNEKDEAMKAAADYLDSDPSARDSSTTVMKVQQGSEPLSFKGFFQNWDHELWA